MAYNKLTAEEERVILNKGTEIPFTGEYEGFFEPGTFICRRCNSPLFSSQSKFEAHCGWPAFDKSFPDALKRIQEPYQKWDEIQCAHCNAHLGHEFTKEGFTETNTRDCVNSISIKFIKESNSLPEVLNEKEID